LLCSALLWSEKFTSVKISHFTTINFYFRKDEQRHQVLWFCNSMNNDNWVLPVISQIFYAWYLQELKSRYSGITLLMINTLEICKILHWYYLKYITEIITTIIKSKNSGLAILEFNRIEMQDLALVYFPTCTTCEITTRIFKEYFHVFYPCCTQEESSRLWKVDLPRV